MGKGDRRSKRGKIFQGTFGKKRPKPQKSGKKAKAAAARQQSLSGRTWSRLSRVRARRIDDRESARPRRRLKSAPAAAFDVRRSHVPEIGFDVERDAVRLGIATDRNGDGRSAPVMAKLRLLKTGHGDLTLAEWDKDRPETVAAAEAAVRRAFHGGAAGLPARRAGPDHADPPVRRHGAGDPDRPGHPGRLIAEVSPCVDSLAGHFSSVRSARPDHDPDGISALGDRGRGRPQPGRSRCARGRLPGPADATGSSGSSARAMPTPPSGSSAARRPTTRSCGPSIATAARSTCAIPDVGPRPFRYSESDRARMPRYWMEKLQREASAFAHEVVRAAASFPQLVISSPALRAGYARLVECGDLPGDRGQEQAAADLEDEPMRLDASTYQQGVPELVAAELVRDVVEPKEFHEFCQFDCVTVMNGDKYYRIPRRPHGLIEVWDAADPPARRPALRGLPGPGDAPFRRGRHEVPAGQAPARPALAGRRPLQPPDRQVRGHSAAALERGLNRRCCNLAPSPPTPSISWRRLPR